MAAVGEVGSWGWWQELVTGGACSSTPAALKVPSLTHRPHSHRGTAKASEISSGLHQGAREWEDSLGRRGVRKKGRQRF